MIAIVAILALAGCSKSNNPSSGNSGGSSGNSGGSSGNSGSSGSGSSSASTDINSWTTNFCSNLDTAVKGLKAEQNAFNAAPSPSDNTGLQQQEVAHLQKYLSLAGTEITALQNGSNPPGAPTGGPFVSGITKTFQTFQTSIQSALTSTNGMDPSSDSFDLSSVTDSVNSAFSSWTDGINHSIDTVNNANNPGDQPLIHAINGNSSCTDALS